MVKLKALYNVGGHVVGQKDDLRAGDVVDLPQDKADKLLKGMYFEPFDPKAEVPDEKASDAKVKTTHTPVIVDSDKTKSPGHFGLAGSVVKGKDGKPVPVGGPASNQTE